jgi:plastocyanin
MTPIGKFAKLLLALTVAAALVLGMSGCKKEEPLSVARTTPVAEPPAAAAPSPKTAADGSQLVEIRVTERGYEPSPVTLKKGEPVTLHVTRTTDRTCATEFILDEHQINEKLPMGQTVTIRFTPEKDGELVYGCGMDKMISGRFVVQ